MRNLDGTTNHPTTYKKVQGGKGVEVICQNLHLFMEELLEEGCEGEGGGKADDGQAKHHNETCKGSWESSEESFQIEEH